MFLKKLNPVRVMLIQDAIFMVSLSRIRAIEARNNARDNELEAISIIKKETSCNTLHARLLIDGGITLEDLYSEQFKKKDK